MSTVTPPRVEAEDLPEFAERDESAPRQSSGRTLVLVAVLAAMAVMLALPVRAWLSQRAGLDELQAEIDAASARVADLEQQRARWQDPVYVESQARQRLNMVKPGEYGLIAINPDDLSKTTESTEAETTWYGRVWESVDAASGRQPAG